MDGDSCTLGGRTHRKTVSLSGWQADVDERHCKWGEVTSREDTQPSATATADHDKGAVWRWAPGQTPTRPHPPVFVRQWSINDYSVQQSLHTDADGLFNKHVAVSLL